MRKFICLHVFILLLAMSCGSGGSSVDGDAEFVASRDFVFNTTVDAATLTQEDSFYIRESFSVQRDETYLIENDQDIDLFNQALTASEQLSITDSDTYTYLFIRDLGCPDYFDYSDHSYSDNSLTITLDHFHTLNVACATVMEEVYLVFKAKK